MSTHLFAFNPKLWNWPTLAGDIRALRRRGHFDTEWSCGRFRHIEPGSRAFMVRLGVAPKGLIGSGVVMTAPAERDHWVETKRASGALSRAVVLRLDELFETPLIGFDELEVPPWRRFRWGVRASGTRLPSALADALEPWWAERVLRARAGAAASAPAPTKRRARQRER